VIVATGHHLVYERRVQSKYKNVACPSVLAWLRSKIATKAPGSGASKRSGLFLGTRGRQGVVALEFALVSIPFFMLVLFVLELSYDLYTQSALDAGLRYAATQLARGNSQNVKDGPTFISQYVCPDLGGLLECSSHLYINVIKFPSSGATDYYSITTGTLPMIGNTLNLAAYTGASSFCNVAPDQFILISLIYLGPSFIGRILPNNALVQQYGGTAVHATLSTVGMATERFNATGVPTGTPVAPPC
jgi:hypothetical protein